MKQKVLGAINALSNTRYFVKLILFAVICAVTVTLSLVFSGVKIAYKVKYGDGGIFIVSEKSDFSKAKGTALKSVDTLNSESCIYTPSFSLILTLPERIASTEEAAQSILENTAELKKSAVLTVNGVSVAFAANKDELNTLMEKRLSAYNVENYQNKSEFTDAVSVDDVYCRESDYTKSSEAALRIDNLSVKTTVKYTTDVVVAYSTVTEKTSEKLVGYRQIKTNGENGLNHNVEEVVMINGEEISRQTLQQDVVKEPVNCVVLVGTASYTANTSAASGLMFPLPRGVKYSISTYFGEKDGAHIHKGIDYAVACGTPIYASESGTVLTSGYKSDYGNYIVINHGNGVKTLYAHCSALYVKAGEEVKKGQTIAAVGSTGWSTGYHLHFEVMVNGKYVNPAKYVG